MTPGKFDINKKFPVGYNVWICPEERWHEQIANHKAELKEIEGEMYYEGNGTIVEYEV